jgi:hypothetical protein
VIVAAVDSVADDAAAVGQVTESHDSDSTCTMEYGSTFHFPYFLLSWYSLTPTLIEIDGATEAVVDFEAEETEEVAVVEEPAETQVPPKIARAPHAVLQMRDL